MSRFTIDLRDMRRALSSVLPHVSQSKANPTLNNMRLLPGPHNLEVSATDRFSVGLALVSIFEHEHDDLEPIDLFYADVRKVLAVFTPPGRDVPDGEALIRVERIGEEVTFTDASGLIEGQALTLPARTLDSFPDVRRVLARHLWADSFMPAHQESWTNATMQARFAAACRAYGEHLIVTRHATLTGQLHLIRCGESFLGLVALTRPADELRGQAAQWRRDWLNRLPAALAQAEYLVPDVAGRLSDPDQEPSEPEEVEKPDLLIAACDLVVTTSFGSVSMLARKLRLGYIRAFKLMDQLGEAGVVSEPNANNEREVLFPPAQLTAALAAVHAKHGSIDNDDTPNTGEDS